MESLQEIHAPLIQQSRNSRHHPVSHIPEPSGNVEVKKPQLNFLDEKLFFRVLVGQGYFLLVESRSILFSMPST